MFGTDLPTYTDADIIGMKGQSCLFRMSLTRTKTQQERATDL